MKKNLKLSSLITLVALFYFTSCTKNEVTNLALSTKSMSFIIGQADSLIATVTASGDISKFPVSWTTTNKNVVSVTNGKIIGLAGGTATITAKSGDLSASCEVTVNNEIAAVMNVGYLEYYGDYFKTGKSNLFVVGIASLDDTLYLIINAPLTATISLPVGSYSVLPSLNNEAADLVPFSVLPGHVYNGSQDNSWYIGRVESPIVEGNFNIISVVNGKYTIELNLIDGYGNTIYGSFQGSLYYYNKSAAVTTSVQSATKSLSSLPHLNLIENRKLINFRAY
ncbi:MAG: Ig-like domain-containing protein [Paludibacter sp.]|nr:Ig-like domain-containing protein [Paludibacter sp.]